MRLQCKTLFDFQASYVLKHVGTMTFYHSILNQISIETDVYLLKPRYQRKHEGKER